MGKKVSSELPLEKDISLQGGDGKEQSVLVKRSRGFMRDLVVRKIQKQRQNGPFKQEGRAALMALVDSSRAHLDAAGLPTDKWPVQPLGVDVSYDPDDHGHPNDDDLWIDYVTASTEALTDSHIAANMLHCLNHLLASLTDDQLSEVFRAMQLYHLHELNGDLNRMAALGTSAEVARAYGPKAKKAQAERAREIVRLSAEKLWAELPQFRNRRDQTAHNIFVLVNTAIEEEGLGKPLAVKTIYNHLLDISKEIT